jgi:hypothetical protein
MLSALRWAMQPQLPQEWSAAQRQAVWEAARRHHPQLAPPPSVPGLALPALLRLQRWNAAVYLALREQGWSQQQAGNALGEASWRLARPGLAALFRLSRLGAQSRLGAVRRSVDALFRWVFSPPFQRRVAAQEADVVFVVVACPLAQYLAQLGLAELTPYVACGLDRRMAELWGVGFARQHTIAQGAPLCDFRFTSL